MNIFGAKAFIMLIYKRFLNFDVLMIIESSYGIG